MSSRFVYPFLLSLMLFSVCAFLVFTGYIEDLKTTFNKISNFNKFSIKKPVILRGPSSVSRFLSEVVKAWRNSCL